ncbi:MAG: ion channel [Bacteroidota bacterium]|nr:ion channel [Bacteroidota bacterium]MDP4233485.1 ion channel [Bacteroidota bacterium]MDP4243363.1 ion channel [Bacteroidota bacterium]MDP4287951.1 ion channel [Bacteroidota bacterium]
MAHQKFQDLGFGTKAAEAQARLLNRDGSFNIRRKGQPFFEAFSGYHYLISIPWWQFSLWLFGAYVLINAGFGAVYYAVGLSGLSGIDGRTAMSQYFESVFFSAQTFTTVGFGRIAPVSALASTVAALESMAGLLSFALATGLLYGRFSRPVARIIYSGAAVVAPYRAPESKATSGLMFRVANQRSNQLIEVEAIVTLGWVEVTEKGERVRRFHQLELERNKVNFFHLSWTVVHPIEPESPLYGITQEQLDAADAEFLIILKAFDDTFSQTVYSRTSYKAHEVLFGHKFGPIIRTAPDGVTEIQLDKIHNHERVS